MQIKLFYISIDEIEREREEKKKSLTNADELCCAFQKILSREKGCSGFMDKTSFLGELPHASSQTSGT